MIHTVRLSDGTVGTLDSEGLICPVEELIGTEIMLCVYDEAGNIVERVGELVEVIE